MKANDRGQIVTIAKRSARLAANARLTGAHHRNGDSLPQSLQAVVTYCVNKKRRIAFGLGTIACLQIANRGIRSMSRRIWKDL